MSLTIAHLSPLWLLQVLPLQVLFANWAIPARICVENVALADMIPFEFQQKWG
jgi:hypothetical protein